MAKRISLIELNFPEALPNRIEQGNLRHQQSDDHTGGIQAQIGAIAGCHVDYRAHTVNIEKISDDKNKNRLIPKNFP